jgi:hypothetical protein
MKDFDSSARAVQIRTAVFSLYGGVVTGVAGAVVAGPVGFVIGWLVGALVMYALSTFAGSAAGHAAASLYMNSGTSTPAAREYSLAQSLVARGRLAEAADEYERCAVVWDSDPEPRLRLARLLRDRMNRPEDAVMWFTRVVRMSEIDEGLAQQTARELVELCRIRLGAPERAIPPLAQIAARRADSPVALWAREQIARIRTELSLAGAAELTTAHGSRTLNVPLPGHLK